ncbi:MAG: protein jag [Acidaminococcales bacterium]|jgi:spoIIIJ-associated protein|nr:protein jag [Acidaminococcales bacterium]
MPNVVEKTGKSLEEALKAALDEIGVEKDKVEYEVVEEKEKKGLFGLFGTKQVTVRVSVRAVAPADAAKEFLAGIFEKMAMEVLIEKFAGEDDTVNLEIYGSDMGLLIGKHGQTLEALQYLANLVANKGRETWVKILLDIENYRKRREETLSKLALRLADKVKRGGERVALEPMNSHERKIIHMALQDDRRITTYSEGEGHYRHVVIIPKK